MMINNNNHVTLVLDGQAGSCGKGKIVGYLTLRDSIDIAINNNMSNSGHTFVFDNGKKIITTHIPISIVNPNTKLLIGPNAVITPEILDDEINKYEKILNGRKIFIHPRAMIIQEKHRIKEKETIRSGSTFKGCGAALSEKIMRHDVELIKDYYNNLSNDIKKHIEIFDTTEILISEIKNGKKVIIEGSQGFDLDINFGLDYPYTTSRQCTASQMLSDCGLPLSTKTKVYMIIRPYPIRISNNTDIGYNIYSGSYDNSIELSWDEIKKRCKAPKDIDITELTTVTKKQRRVFEFNDDRFKKADDIIDPTNIVLNFAQYLNYNDLEKTDYFDLSIETYNFLLKIENLTKKFITIIGTGEKNSNIIDIDKIS